MGHSENRGRRRLTLPLQPRAKLIGLSILIAGFASLITSAQLDPIMAQVERVIDGDTIHVRVDGNRYTVRLIGVDTPETKHPTKAVQYFGRGVIGDRCADSRCLKNRQYRVSTQ